MNLYNEQSEEIKTSQIAHLFHEILPPEEVHEYIYRHTFRFNREGGLVVELSFMDFENEAYISISKHKSRIVDISYHKADYIKLIDEKYGIFEIISMWVKDRCVSSKTLLALSDSPIVRFNNELENDIRIMDVVPCDLMMLFDDFDEIQHESRNKSYRFLCKRFSESAELTIFPDLGKLSLIIKSEEICLCTLELVNCDRVIVNLKKKKLYFTSGFNENEEMSYIEGCLDLNEHLYLFIQPNSKPWLRGLG